MTRSEAFKNLPLYALVPTTGAFVFADMAGRDELALGIAIGGVCWSTVGLAISILYPKRSNDQR